MTNEECFEIWAPDGAVWSPWAKPVTFVELDKMVAVDHKELPWETSELGYVPPAGHIAIVADVPGPVAVCLGVALARVGYRPVPLFNATTGPSPVLDLEPIARRLVKGADLLREMGLPESAPPAFLLDAERMHPGTLPIPGRFDNRWVTFPQDFPSATFLRAHGITEALLIQVGRPAPEEDLAHVLRRWQDSALRLTTADLSKGGVPEPLVVERPSRFRLAWYVAVALLGLRRANVGGFGGVIPQQTGGSGFYG